MGIPGGSRNISILRPSIGSIIYRTDHRVHYILAFVFDLFSSSFLTASAYDLAVARKINDFKPPTLESVIVGIVVGRCPSVVFRCV